jgi:uncharacterized protein
LIAVDKVIENFFIFNKQKLYSMEEFRINTSEERFEMEVDGHIGYITFVISDGVYHMAHTIVPPEIGGRGVAKRLAIQTFDYLREKGLKANVTCSYLVAFKHKNPDYSDVII